jgi:hypothetical protein
MDTNYRLETYAENAESPDGVFPVDAADIEDAVAVAGALVQSEDCDYGALYLDVAGGDLCYLGFVTVVNEVVTLSLPCNELAVLSDAGYAVVA